jgi:Zn-dependent M32 family carboxypeptidase
LLAWLTKNIYAAGDRFSAEDLITRVTGKGLDAGAYFRHVEKNYR